MFTLFASNFCVFLQRLCVRHELHICHCWLSSPCVLHKPQHTCMCIELSAVVTKCQKKMGIASYLRASKTSSNMATLKSTEEILLCIVFGGEWFWGIQKCCRTVFMPEFRQWAFDFHRNATILRAAIAVGAVLFQISCGDYLFWLGVSIMLHRHMGIAHRVALIIPQRFYVLICVRL